MTPSMAVARAVLSSAACLIRPVNPSEPASANLDCSNVGVSASNAACAFWVTSVSSFVKLTCSGVTSANARTAAVAASIPSVVPCIPDFASNPAEPTASSCPAICLYSSRNAAAASVSPLLIAFRRLVRNSSARDRRFPISDCVSVENDANASLLNPNPFAVSEVSTLNFWIDVTASSNGAVFWKSEYICRHASTSVTTAVPANPACVPRCPSALATVVPSPPSPVLPVNVFIVRAKPPNAAPSAPIEAVGPANFVSVIVSKNARNASAPFPRTGVKSSPTAA